MSQTPKPGSEEFERDVNNCRKVIEEALAGEIMLTEEEAEFMRRAHELPVFDLPVKKCPTLDEREEK